MSCSIPQEVPEAACQHLACSPLHRTLCVVNLLSHLLTPGTPVRCSLNHLSSSSKLQELPGTCGSTPGTAQVTSALFLPFAQSVCMLPSRAKQGNLLWESTSVQLAVNSAQLCKQRLLFFSH